VLVQILWLTLVLILVFTLEGTKLELLKQYLKVLGSNPCTVKVVLDFKCYLKKVKSKLHMLNLKVLGSNPCSVKVIFDFRPYFKNFLKPKLKAVSNDPLTGLYSYHLKHQCM